MNHFISSVGSFQASQNKKQAVKVSATESLQSLPSSSTQLFANILNNTQLNIKVVTLQKTYMPTILAHDAMYLVVCGSGSFYKGITTKNFVQGDVLLADKGVQHFFDNFTNNAIVWQIFYDENKNK